MLTQSVSQSVYQSIFSNIQSLVWHVWSNRNWCECITTKCKKNDEVITKSENERCYIVTTFLLSNWPGSMASGLLVAPITTTCPRESKPSINASRVETIEAWIWSCLTERTGAKPSISIITKKVNYNKKLVCENIPLTSSKQ